MKEIIYKELCRNSRAYVKNFIVILLSFLFIFQFWGVIEGNERYKNVFAHASFGIRIPSNDLSIEELNNLSNIDGYKAIKLYYSIDSIKIGDNHIKDDFRIMTWSLSETIQNYKGDIPSYNSTDMVIAIPKEYMNDNKLKIGDKLNINSYILKIIGVTDSSLENSFVISIPTYKKIGLSIDNIFFHPKLNIDLDDIPYIFKRIKQVTGVEGRLENSEVLEEQDTIGRNYNKHLVIVSIISLLNISMMTVYIQRKRLKTFFIYKVMGMTKKKYFVLNLILGLIIFIPSFLLAILFSYLLNDIFFKRIANLVFFHISIKSYLIIFIILFFIYLFILLVIDKTINISDINKYDLNKNVLRSYHYD